MLVGVEFSSGAPSSIAGFLDFLAEVYKALGHLLQLAPGSEQLQPGWLLARVHSRHELDAAKTDVHNHAATKTGTYAQYDLPEL